MQENEKVEDKKKKNREKGYSWMILKILKKNGNQKMGIKVQIGNHEGTYILHGYNIHEEETFLSWSHTFVTIFVFTFRKHKFINYNIAQRTFL